LLMRARTPNHIYLSPLACAHTYQSKVLRERHQPKEAIIREEMKESRELEATTAKVVSSASNVHRLTKRAWHETKGF